MQTNHEPINLLVYKYLLNELRDEEKAQLDAWVNQSDKNRELFEKLSDRRMYADMENVKKKIADQLKGKTKIRMMDVSRRWIWQAAVVAALAILGISVFLWQDHNAKENETIAKSDSKTNTAVDKDPGKDGAILKLSNGTVIIIDSMANGTLSSESGTNILKVNGQVVYHTHDVPGGYDEPLYNTLSTPRGRQIQLSLPDGSKVWLNASSSITFPAAFTGTERRVEITGEAYFEVAQVSSTGSEGTRRKMPFIVHVNSSKGDGMDVLVLGTHFNINAYGEETNIKTTLLEGLVKITTPTPKAGVNKTAFLKPGQQAVLTSQTGSDIKVVSNADVDGAVAWKNGLIVFNRSDVKAILRQISRWYDVNILYQDSIPSEEIKGVIPRKMKLSEALHALEISSGLKFTFDGNTIIVKS